MIRKFEEFINEAKLPKFDHETADMSKLYDYVKDNYEFESNSGRGLERMTSFGYGTDGSDGFLSTSLRMPLFFDKDKPAYLIPEYYRTGERTLEVSYFLVKKLEEKDKDAWNELKDTIKAACSKNKVYNEFVIWVYDKIIEILGDECRTHKKEK